MKENNPCLIQQSGAKGAHEGRTGLGVWSASYGELILLGPILRVKRFALAGLFLLGIVELLFPVEVHLLFYAYDPQFRTSLTDKQQHLYQQFHAAMTAKSRTVFCFGVITMIIGILLVSADRRGRRMPNNHLQPTPR